MSLPLPIPSMAFMCRMCEHMANAHEKGLDDCGHGKCGGPMSGHAFPEYKGPLESDKSLYCYMCGVSAELIMTIDDGANTKKLGICKNCADFMENELKGLH